MPWGMFTLVYNKKLRKTENVFFTIPMHKYTTLCPDFPMTVNNKLLLCKNKCGNYFKEYKNRLSKKQSKSGAYAFQSGTANKHEQNPLSPKRKNSESRMDNRIMGDVSRQYGLFSRQILSAIRRSHPARH
ncbi:MAG: hypothetical protein ACLFQB_09135 [Chitinispirillaceae bacterium]